MKPSRNIEELEEIATRIRCGAGLENIGTFDVIEVTEQRLPKIFPGLKLIRVSDEQLPHAEAEANSSTNTILIRESTYQQAKSWRCVTSPLVTQDRAIEGTRPKEKSTVEQKSGTSMRRANWPHSYWHRPL
jgi:hypothetical protein